MPTIMKYPIDYRGGFAKPILL